MGVFVLAVVFEGSRRDIDATDVRVRRHVEGDVVVVQRHMQRGGQVLVFLHLLVLQAQLTLTLLLF